MLVSEPIIWNPTRISPCFGGVAVLLAMVCCHRAGVSYVVIQQIQRQYDVYLTFT